MCGLCGVYRFNQAPVTPEDQAGAEAMAAAQRHRGPDDEGCEAS